MGLGSGLFGGSGGIGLHLRCWGCHGYKVGETDLLSVTLFYNKDRSRTRIAQSGGSIRDS